MKKSSRSNQDQGQAKLIISQPSPEAEKSSNILLERVKGLLQSPPNLEYLKFLTNQTGIIQHANHGIPSFRNGYSVDDNARALVAVMEHFRQYNDKESLKLAKIYLSLLDYVQDEDGRFFTYLSYNHDFTSQEKSEDAFGRAVWAVGFTIYISQDKDIRNRASEIFNNCQKVGFNKLVWPRSWAYSLVGLYYFYQAKREAKILETMAELANKLVKEYSDHLDESNGWYWYENQVTYSNSLIPLSLLLTYQLTKKSRFREVAEETFQFILKNTSHKGYPSPIGEKGWWAKGGEKSRFDQQPIEAGYTVWAASLFYTLLKDEKYLDWALRWFLWYYGENSPRVKIYEEKTGICRDGITPNGLNRNGGAESIITYLIARLTLQRSLKEKR